MSSVDWSFRNTKLLLSLNCYSCFACLNIVSAMSRIKKQLYHSYNHFLQSYFFTLSLSITHLISLILFLSLLKSCRKIIRITFWVFKLNAHTFSLYLTYLCQICISGHLLNTLDNPSCSLLVLFLNFLQWLMIAFYSILIS